MCCNLLEHIVNALPVKSRTVVVAANKTKNATIRERKHVRFIKVLDTRGDHIFDHSAMNEYSEN